ncbi:TIGR02757 family protein [Campylobacter helveticus]|uniref:TIGR02757 family protein n=1 Tax=Campylobacter helveticus TaxID=28898 RepID=UPI0022EB8B74|nr:TIGR02757 family protein [Campylobacter helveticus]
MLKAELDKCVEKTAKEFDSIRDPLHTAKKFKDPCIALMCALFSYGNVENICNFLEKLDKENAFALIDKSEKDIKEAFKNLTYKYRFQSQSDVEQIFITFAKLKKTYDLEKIFTEPYQKSGNITDGILNCIKEIYKINAYTSKGYTHFFGKVWKKEPTSPLKRYNMFLRWMVRKSEIDMGLWKQISTADLLIPLDVHTKSVSLREGLLERKSYDFKAVLKLTQKLKEFDPKDPIKYDFALYRLGQGGASGT